VKDAKDAATRSVCGWRRQYLRGLAGAAQVERATGDYMGMLATVMNALAMQSTLERIGVETRVQSAIPMASYASPISSARRAAYREGPRGDLCRGTGNPFFTTDSGAALRAAEMQCDALFKGTSVGRRL